MIKHILKVNEKDFNEALNDWLDGNENANILGFKKFFYEWKCKTCLKVENDYIIKPSKLYIACDNTGGDFWVEEFHNLKDCIDWLNDQY